MFWLGIALITLLGFGVYMGIKETFFYVIVLICALFALTEFASAELTTFEPAVWESENETLDVYHDLSLSTVVPEPDSTIRVTVPFSSSVILNPYSLEIEAGGERVRDQVVSTPIVFSSQTELPLTLTVASSQDPNFNYAMSYETLDPKKKEIFLWLEFVNMGRPDGDPIWSDYYNNASYQTVVGSPAKQVLRMPAASIESPTYGAFKVFGVMGLSTSDPWTAADTTQVTLVFTFALDAGE